MDAHGSPASTTAPTIGAVEELLRSHALGDCNIAPPARSPVAAEKEPPAVGDRTERLRIAYDVAVELHLNENSLAWSRFNAILVSNGVLLAGGLSCAAMGVWSLAASAFAIGALLAVPWYGITCAGFLVSAYRWRKASYRQKELIGSALKTGLEPDWMAQEWDPNYRIKRDDDVDPPLMYDFVTALVQRMMHGRSPIENYARLLVWSFCVVNCVLLSVGLWVLWDVGALLLHVAIRLAAGT